MTVRGPWKDFLLTSSGGGYVSVINMKAIIIGASGLTGSFLLQDLLNDASITEVISVSRRPLGFKQPKYREILLSDLSGLPDLEGQLKADLYFCCLGTTIKTAGSQENFRKVDHEAVAQFGKIAYHHDAKSLTVVSAMGADAGSRIFYNRVKGEMEDDLKSLQLKSLILFHPGFLKGPRKEYRLGEHVANVVLTPLSLIMPKSLKDSLITSVPHLAKRILEEGKKAPEGVTIINARDI